MSSLEALLRPPVELYSAATTACAGTIALTMPWALQCPTPVGLGVATAAFGFAYWRGKQGYEVLRYTMGLKKYKITSIAPHKIPNSRERLYLGDGFLWTQKHTQRLMDARSAAGQKFLEGGKLSNMTGKALRAMLKGLRRAAIATALVNALVVPRWWNPLSETPDLGGSTLLHGVEPKEIAVSLNQKLRSGHMLVIGTTRVGKTRLMELLVTQDIRDGKVVIVLDPKGDRDLMLRVYAEAARAGRLDQFYLFHLGFPEISARYNGIGNFARVTEIANRTTNALPASGNSAAFKEFSWRFVNLVAQAPDAANPGNAQSGNRGLFGGKGITDFLPDFSGRSGKTNPGTLNPATLSPATGGDGTLPQAAAPQSRTVIPMGYSAGKGADGREGLVRTAPSGMPVTGQKPQSYAQAANESNTAMASNSAQIDPATGQVQGAAGSPTNGTGKKDKPFWTIPENATLIGATAMTAIVGRVPVDGHVQDPMQFKLLLGPTNLAANGHFLPPDLAGIVLSGIAIGDMTLSCSEGVIQSLTFVFNDGSIRTVSMGNTGGAGAGQQAGNGISNMAKLGFLSDRYGNPCITGKFVTNAPAFLTDVVGLKALSLAGKAAASSQTTTSSNSLGTSSSTVSGAKGTYILGETVSGATDSVSDWLTRRMGSSFDAVVTPAGAEVVIHINREIAIDKTGNARKIDYGRMDSVASSRKGAHHGLD